MPLPVLSAVLLLATTPQILKPSPSAPSAQTAPAAPRPAVRFDLRLVRIDSAAADAASTSGANAPSTGAAPPITPPPAGATASPQAVNPPVAVATPTLNTLDLGTATITVTNPELGYSLALSPTIENTEKRNGAASVLALWNLRLSGKSLPGGTNVVTMSGSTRIPSGSAEETTLAEVPLRDLKTGQTSLFRLTARVTITPPAVTAER